MSDLARKRRWSFSLRTLFVIVTLFACSLGYEMNWIHRRRQFLKNEAVHFASGKKPPELYLAEMEWPSPFPLRILGEPGAYALVVNLPPDHYDSSLPDEAYDVVKRAKRLFPEAQQIVAYPPTAYFPFPYNGNALEQYRMRAKRAAELGAATGGE